MPTERAEVIIADAERAVSAPWFDAARTAGHPRIVLISRIDALLRPWRAAGLAVLRAPFAAPALLDAIDGRDVPAAPRPASRNSKRREAVVAASRELPELPGLVASATRLPMMLLTTVDDTHQTFVMQGGLPDDLAIAGGSLRAWSLCRHVVDNDAPLIVNDARLHPELAETPLVAKGLVRAYAGIPVRDRDGAVVATVCALSPDPHEFAASEIASLRLAAGIIESRLPPPPSEHEHTVPARPMRAAPPPPHDDGLVGALLDGKFLVTGKLGEGGSSFVYLARDTTIGTLVAVKVVHKESAAAALLEEARTLASIRHPNVVQIFGWGRTTNEQIFLVLEYVKGRSLSHRARELLTEGLSMSVDELLATLSDVAGALETLHGAGYVHGDVKAANILLDRQLGRRVLVDFGLSMRLPSGARSPSGKLEMGASLGRVGGTPGYSAPEQMLSTGPSVPAVEADVYGIATLAYLLLAMRGPFGRPGTDQGEPGVRPPIFASLTTFRPDLPGLVDDVFRRALSAEPRERHRSPTNFLDALRGALAGKKIPVASLGLPGESRGSAFARVSRVVAELLGDEGEGAVRARMSGSDCAAFEAATDPHEWYASSSFLSYLRAYEHLAPVENLGAAAFRVIGPRELAGINIDRSPHTLMRSFQPLFARFHTWCIFEFRPTSSDAMEVTLDLRAEHAPAGCRYVGGMMRASLLTVRKVVTVHHVRCRANGDPRCILDVRWRQ